MSASLREKELFSLDIGLVFSNLVGLFLLIGAGFFIVKIKLVPSHASKTFSTLLMNLTMPASVFVSFLRPLDTSFLRDSLITIAVGTGLYLLYALLCLPCARLLRVPQGRRGIWMFCATFNNVAFMGFPISLALFGEEGLAFAVMLSIPFNLLLYTMGVKMVCTDCQETNAIQSWGSVLLSPVNLAILLGLLFYALQLQLPDMVLTPLNYLSNITTPLSMIVTGMNLTYGSLTAPFRDRDAVSASVMRLALLPLLTWGLVRLLPLENPLVFPVTILIMAMPSPAVSTILAERYHGNAQLSARIVFLSSLLCLASIPLMSLLL